MNPDLESYAVRIGYKGSPRRMLAIPIQKAGSGDRWAAFRLELDTLAAKDLAVSDFFAAATDLLGKHGFSQIRE